MKPSHCLCLLLLASIFMASSAVVTVSPKKETAAWAAPAPAVVQPDETFLVSLCEQQLGRPSRILPWCKQLHARRHRLPMPPPSRDDGEDEIDPLYGVSKRLVPSGPNRLHN